MTVDKRLISVNFTKGGNAKLGVVIHTMVGNLDGTDTFFRNPTSLASSHYGVDLDGSRVYQWVEEDDQAYAQGLVSVPTFKLTVDRPGVNPNTYLLSIECADGKDPAGADRSKQLPVLAELLRDICKRNNIPLDREHICGHREIRSTKTCPGNIDVDSVINLAKMLDQNSETFTDDEKRALSIIKAFKTNTDELKAGNFEGAANALVGAYRDIGGLKTALDTLVSFRDGIANQLNVSGQTDPNKIATELSVALKENAQDKDEAGAGLMLFEIVTNWVNGQTWSWPADVDSLLIKLNEKINNLKPPVYTPPDNVEGLTYVGRWKWFTHHYLHFKQK